MANLSESKLREELQKGKLRSLYFVVSEDAFKLDYYAERALRVLFPDGQPVVREIVYGDEIKPFTERTIEMKDGDLVYIFSDGYPDQFGGVKGKKYLYTRFKETLLEMQRLGMHEQYQHLETKFLEWKGENEQVDDVLVMGFRF